MPIENLLFMSARQSSEMMSWFIYLFASSVNAYIYCNSVGGKLSKGTTIHRCCSNLSFIEQRLSFALNHFISDEIMRWSRRCIEIFPRKMDCIFTCRISLRVFFSPFFDKEVYWNYYNLIIYFVKEINLNFIWIFSVWSFPSMDNIKMKKEKYQFLCRSTCLTKYTLFHRNFTQVPSTWHRWNKG